MTATLREDRETDAAMTRPASLRVMLVDDHPIVRRGLRDILADALTGAIIHEVGSGREALASFSARVSGPIVQRVVYADWDPDFRAELEQIAGAHGFYVVGLERHSGYVAAM